MIDYGLATSERWKELLAKFAKNSMIRLDDPYYRIVTIYNKIDRHYHNLNHISNCLAELDSVGKTAFHYPMESEVAIWYHDFVYDINETDNEEKSSLVANGYLWALGFDLEQRTRVNQIIIATKHNEKVTDHDSQLVCDIDLATLGKPKNVFEEYEKAIREEYYIVPDKTYCPARIKILEKFLAKDSIYYTEFFKTKYESQARSNIEESLEELRKVVKYL